jgi:hypothetical protein
MESFLTFLRQPAYEGLTNARLFALFAIFVIIAMFTIDIVRMISKASQAIVENVAEGIR